MNVSAIVITKNEERMLSACLKTLQWADEVIVIDTGSTDETIRIAKKHKAKVFNYKGSGSSFSDWRNYAARKANSEWLLYVDADERIENNLKQEVLAKLDLVDSIYTYYAIPRKNVVLGRELRYGGWYPDYVKRLLRKDVLVTWQGQLHENPVMDGTMGYLENSLVHIKHETITEMIEKTNKWSEIEGKLMYESGHPPMNVMRFLTAMGREFWNRMIVHKAFLDGSIGIIFAMYQVFSRFVSYAKLWEMQVTHESSNS